MEVNVARKSVGKMNCRIVLGAFSSPAVLRLYAPVVCNSPGITTCRHGTLSIRAGFDVVGATSRTKCGHLDMIGYASSRIGIRFSGPSPRTNGTTLNTLRQTVRSCHRKLVSMVIATPVGGRAVRSRRFSFPKRARCVRRHLNGKGGSLVVLVGGSFHITLIAARVPIERVTAAVAGRLVRRGLVVFRRYLGRSFNVNTPHVTILSLGPRTKSNNLLNARRRRIVVPTVGRVRRGKVLYCKPCTTSNFVKSNGCARFSKVLTVCRSRKLTPFGTLTVSSKMGCATKLPMIHASPTRNATCSVTNGKLTDRSSFHRTICITVSIFHGHRQRGMTRTGPLQGRCCRGQSSDSGLGLSAMSRSW